MNKFQQHFSKMSDSQRAKSANELAEFTGKSINTVYNWISGRKNPNIYIIPSIEEFFSGRIKAKDIRPDLYEIFFGKKKRR